MDSLELIVTAGVYGCLGLGILKLFKLKLRDLVIGALIGLALYIHLGS